MKNSMEPSEDSEKCVNSHKDVALIVEYDTFMSAKHAELSNWRKNNGFEDVTCLSTRWVCTLKETSEGVTPKAR